jgi:hypothetical protein
MKFGDLVVNEFTSAANPYHVLMYVRRSGKYYECLSWKGERMQFDTRHKNITVVGNVDFSAWNTARVLALAAPEAPSAEKIK